MENVMPVYDYECADCGAFEAVRRIAERDDPAVCPHCGATAARVTIGAPSVGGASSSGDVAEGAGSYGMSHRGGCFCCR
jgi:putative FmdB family regulatory protein